jgi:2-(1,2-epoxy-1,2-dihydrophenyl)acetyl-CoA isomerase
LVRMTSQPMTYQFIQRDVQAGVLTVTMNRPEVLNSCNRAMVTEMRGVFEAPGSDDTVRAVLLTGAGRAFCAGQDLAEAVPADGSPAPDIGDIVRGTTGSFCRCGGWKSRSSVR